LRSQTYRAAPSWDATTAGRRGSGLGLALAANLLILFVLLGLGAAKYRPRNAGDALVVDLLPSPAESAPPAGKTAELTQKRRPPPPPAAPPYRVKQPLDLLVMTKEEFAAADISKLPRSADGNGRAAGDSEEAGRAPNGEILYSAEWFRRPTDAELAGYLPRNAPEGWGLVACRTIPDHRVEDCVELGNYPAGSRLAGAVRQAAWQFRVRPPRKNGRELVGAWVQIRIEYVHTAAR
jgi:periplasmic protein TonB